MSGRLSGRLASAGLRAGLVADLPPARVAGGGPVPGLRRHRLAPPGAQRAGPGGQPAPGAGPGRHRGRRPRGIAGINAVICALLAGGVPAARDAGGAADRAGCGMTARSRPRSTTWPGPGRDLRAAAHGQLGPGRGMDHRPGGRLVHHGHGAPGARVAVRAVRRVPRGTGHGGAACQRRTPPVRRAGPAAAGGQAGLPAVRPGRDRRRHRGGLLRREGADDGRAGRAGRADRRRADAGHAVVRG